MRKRTTLRLSLILTLAVALSPILVIGALESYVNAKKSVEDRRSELIRVTTHAADDLERSLTKAESFLRVFSPYMADGRCNQVKREVIPELPVLTNVIHFDTQGMSTCSSVSDTPHQVTNLNWIEKLKDGTQLLRTDAFYGPITETYFFSMFLRTEDGDDNFTGASAFSMRADALVSLLKASDYQDGMDIAIADQDGRIFGSKRFGQVPATWFEDSRKWTESRLIRDRDASGKSLDIVITKVATEGVFVVVSRPSPGLLSYFTLAPISGVGLPLLAFTIALIAVWISLDRLVLKWLTRLKRIAKIYGAGKYNLRTAHHFEPAPEEFLEFAETMDTMAHQIDSRDSRLRDALQKRDEAVKEIHHRVKNNLQIVTSFLNLQARQVRDPAAKSAIASAQHRIDALSIVHQTLYQNERLDSVELKPFFEGLLRHLSQALGMEDADVTIDWELANVVRKSDDAIPLALFIVEAITNSMKYAFVNGGTIFIRLSADKNNALKLIVTDSGNGPGDLGLASMNEGNGLGSKLMKAFARQLKAEHSSSYSKEEGFSVLLEIPAEH